MRGSSLLQLLLLLILPLLTTARHFRRDAESSVEEEAARLKLDRDVFVVREGDKLMMSCVYEKDDLTEMKDLNWKTSVGKEIDGASSGIRFTIALHEHGTHFKKKALHFVEIHKRDAGNYTCEAKNVEGKVFRRTVRVHVLEKIAWSSTEERVGGLIGEPLTVDCKGEARPTPSITITDDAGEPLDDNLFMIANSEVSIAALTKEYNGFKVTCNALQELDDLDDTASSKRTVTIDVWFAPEFEKERIERHAILGRTATLHCNVTASNPPATQFIFRRNTKVVESSTRAEDNHKYNQIMMIDHASTLQISDVQPEDLGEYECEVFNGRVKATQTIMLKQANPPEDLRVTLLHVRKHALVWRIETSKHDVLPVERIEIQHMRKEFLENEAEEDVEKIWRANSNVKSWALNDSGEYDIGSLRADTEYVFRFRGESEAGFGARLTVDGSTKDEVPPEALNAASPLTLALALLSPLILML